MTPTRTTLLGAAAWGAAFIVAAIAFRGQALGDWIEGALLVGFLTFLSVRVCRMALAAKKS